jgi:DNA-binding response OmpR family regulator
MLHVLIVEDESKVANFIKRGLEENNYSATVANDGFIGLKLAFVNNFDFIILDINLPKLNGMDVCKQIREKGIETPIIFLTASGGMNYKIEGFESGADDYLVKPFDFNELLARMQAIYKRVNAKSGKKTLLKIANLELDSHARTVKRNNEFITLTQKEFNLLEYLLINKQKTVSRAEIAEKIWDITFDSGTNVIDVYVNFLRKKIDKNYEPKLIHTVLGVGYILEEKLHEHS